jgi:hypothetical protein
MGKHVAHVRDRRMSTGFGGETSKERDSLQDIDSDGTIILKVAFAKEEGTVHEISSSIN